MAPIFSFICKRETENHLFYALTRMKNMLMTKENVEMSPKTVIADNVSNIKYVNLTILKITSISNVESVHLSYITENSIFCAEMHMRRQVLEKIMLLVNCTIKRVLMRRKYYLTFNLKF